MFRLQFPKEAALPVWYRQPPFDRCEGESCSCAYSVGLSDISAAEQIREESELSVKRIPPFQICIQAKQQTAQTLVWESDFSQAFLQTIRFYCWETTKNTAEYAAVNTSLPPTLSTFMSPLWLMLEPAMWYNCIFPYKIKPYLHVVSFTRWYF